MSENDNNDDSNNEAADGARRGHEMRGTDAGELTRRGMMTKRCRGHFVGERTFGYRSEPRSGALDRHGRSRPAGHDMAIEDAAARVVRRVFTLFAAGKSIASVAKSVNEEAPLGVAAPSASSVARMLANEKYVGIWAWNRTRRSRDRATGKVTVTERPRGEWIVAERPDLRIVSEAIWQRVQRRLRRGRKP